MEFTFSFEKVSAIRRTDLFVILLLAFGPSPAECSTISDAQALQTKLLTNYSKDIIPVSNQFVPITVNASLYLRSIQELNEVTEEFFFIGAFELAWTDANMVWDPADYGYISLTYISYEKVWVPELILTTTSDKSDSLAKKWQRVRYLSDGQANIVVGGRIKATCGVNVEKFPFDKQTCKMVFQAWGYLDFHLSLAATNPSAFTHQYTKNNQWDLDGTKLESTVIDSWPTLEVSFYLSRKSSFTVISLVTPLLLMSVLNLFVFLLAPESGERVSYCITVLLAIAVFMTIISDALPSSSEPVPVITYKLMADLVISGLITLVTIFNIGVYHRDEKKPVPASLKALYLCLCCRRRKQNTIFVTENDANAINKVKQAVVLPRSTEKVERNGDIKVTWKEISSLIDYISLVIFSTASLLVFIIYIAKVMS